MCLAADTETFPSSFPTTSFQHTNSILPHSRLHRLKAAPLLRDDIIHSTTRKKTSFSFCADKFDLLPNTQRLSEQPEKKASNTQHQHANRRRCRVWKIYSLNFSAAAAAAARGDQHELTSWKFFFHSIFLLLLVAIAQLAVFNRNYPCSDMQRDLSFIWENSSTRRDSFSSFFASSCGWIKGKDETFFISSTSFHIISVWIFI